MKSCSIVFKAFLSLIFFGSAFADTQEEQIYRALSEFQMSPHPITLQGTIQHYEWGGSTFIPILLRKNNKSRKPYAELWIGAHPIASSKISSFDIPITLRDLISHAAGEILGNNSSNTFQRQLPYLFKVLDAKKMLSIQAHPNKEQAEEGFARENAQQISLSNPQRNYKDPNHKPEVCCALTDFWMLHGFRPVEEIVSIFKSVPEFSSIADDVNYNINAQNSSEEQSTWLKAMYSFIMNMPQDRVDAILNPLINRVLSDYERYEAGDRFKKDDVDFKDTPEFWTARAALFFPLPNGHRDRGIFSLYLLNLLHIKAGEGTYQPAGVLHAYLEGVTIELMANSDNVLRGGLTSKHVDVDELLKTIVFKGEKPSIILGEEISPTERVYRTPAGEFELSRINISKESSYTSVQNHGADSLIVLGSCNEDGTASIVTNVTVNVYPNKVKDWNGPKQTLKIHDHQNNQGYTRRDENSLAGQDVGDGKTNFSTCFGITTKEHAMQLQTGEICFIPNDVAYSLESSDNVILYRATVPLALEKPFQISQR